YVGGRRAGGMNLKAQRAAALKAAQEIVDAAKAANRELTEDEQATVAAKLAEVDDLDTKIKAAEKSDATMARLAALGPVDGDEGDREAGQDAKTLGEHFIKAVGQEGLTRVKDVRGTTLTAPEWRPEAKANNDPQLRPASLAPWMTTYDRTVVRAFRRPVVSD